jgi:hypothetical protein
MIVLVRKTSTPTEAPICVSSEGLVSCHDYCNPGRDAGRKDPWLA